MRPDLDVESALVLAGVAVASWMLVGVLRRYAIARGVVDRPQERSSHTSPTPRGGGAGLIVAAMAGFLMQLPSGSTDWRIVLALLAVIPAAVVG
jgi:Fuc2NAc and GlcNAc transferase